MLAKTQWWCSGDGWETCLLSQTQLCAKDMKHTKQEEQAAAERRMRQSPRSNF